ncbi:uncharacterized protein LOC117124464 isoform X2 [Anneissia japonica]|uniref:uncharacterized protein LOC117124464 isoform X2 n=1 Tax=Anneissia japonica TaxID=1529436 RepID=UPI0014256A5F|nr:uncharacterized protein LOC117124464 isoform X2 [Anneissia japonica]
MTTHTEQGSILDMKISIVSDDGSKIVDGINIHTGTNKQPISPSDQEVRRDGVPSTGPNEDTPSSTVTSDINGSNETGEEFIHPSDQVVRRRGVLSTGPKEDRPRSTVTFEVKDELEEEEVPGKNSDQVNGGDSEVFAPSGRNENNNRGVSRVSSFHKFSKSFKRQSSMHMARLNSRSGEEDLAIVNEEDGCDDSDEDIEDDPEQMMRYVDESVIGKDASFVGPYGERKVTYCDYTASGRPLKFIEEYITEHVQPLYANTHTTTSVMAKQTTRFREEAREIIKKCVNASDQDTCIFTGSGTTGAIHKLVNALDLKSKAKKAVVFVGPYEHHSNLLPWKESGAKVIRIKDTPRGTLDLEHLKQNLKRFRSKGRFLMGCFSAASNVTGILTDTLDVASLLHEYGALSCWDYATAAPYVKIDMNPDMDSNSTQDFSKDAVYLSPHKFVGGPGTPGILIAKKKLFMSKTPGTVGGGTVAYVTRETHHYIKNIEEREEGGTPAILESIRAGLTFQVKESIGIEEIERNEHALTRRAFMKWRETDNILILGSKRAKRLPIFSFLILNPQSGRILHHNFVAAVLNDLYGIQARGGCACAGPYAQDLLGINEDLAEQFVYFLLDDEERKNKQGKSFSGSLGIMKPGFVRLNLPFFYSKEVIDFILDAVDDVANNAWKLLPQYQFDAKSGGWEHRSSPKTGNDSLLTAKLIGGKFRAPASPYVSRKTGQNAPVHTDANLQEYLEQARNVYAEAEKAQKYEALNDPDMDIGDTDPALIWFLQPKEAARIMTSPEDYQAKDNVDSGVKRSQQGIPFTPKRYSRWRSKRMSSRRQKSQTEPDDEEKNSIRCSIM